jgi:hypothetical protein
MCVRVCVRVCLCARVCLCVCVCMCVQLCVFLRGNALALIYVCVCVYNCVYGMLRTPWQRTSVCRLGQLGCNLLHGIRFFMTK